MNIKKTTFTLLAGLSVAVSAQAGEDYSAKASPVVVAPPCLWSWFAGGSVGTLSDFDETMYTLHVGTELKCPDSSCSHALFLEVGYTEGDDTYGHRYTPGKAISTSHGYYKFDVEIIPITFNYKYECSLTDKLNWYVGAGAGVALVDMDIKGSGAITKSSSASFDDTVFYAHVFAGIVYNVSDSFEIFAGARYIFMDDPDLTGMSAIDDSASLDEDVLIEIGGRVNF